MWVTELQVIEYFMLWTEYIMEEHKDVVGWGPERKRQKGRKTQNLTNATSEAMKYL